MELKYYLRGLGLGIVVTALIMGFALSGKEPMSDDEIRARAKQLGMIEDTVLAGNGADEEADNSADADTDADNSTDADTDADTVAGTDKNTETDPITLPEISNEDVEALSEAEETQKEIEEIKENADNAGKTDDTQKPEAGNEDSEDAEALPQGDSADNEDVAALPKGDNEDAAALPKGDNADNEDAAALPKTDNEDSEDGGEESETANKPITGDVTITISRGDGSYTVSKKLADAGVVSSAEAYDRFLCQNGFDKKIRTGTYTIPSDASDEQMARIITGAE